MEASPAGSVSGPNRPPAVGPAAEPINLAKTDARRGDELSQTRSGENPSVITLESGQTLSEVSLRYLGRFNNELEQEFQKLNPEIKNPDVVYAGTQVRLPPPPGAFDQSNPVTEADSAPQEHSR
ncbi:MAG: LysM peptidoglycan-binding domain-containing protein [Candidatus Acidiferrales bacterium]